MCRHLGDGALLSDSCAIQILQQGQTGAGLCSCESLCCSVMTCSMQQTDQCWQLAACLAKHRQNLAVPSDRWCMRCRFAAWPDSQTPLPMAGSRLRVCSQHGHPAGPALGLPRALPRSPGGRLPADLLLPRTADGGGGCQRSRAGAGWGDLCGLHTPDEHHPGLGLQVGAAWTS